MIDESRAISAFTDVLAVEHDEETGVFRVVTIRECYTAVPSEGLHLCPDREYNDIDLCKHVIATEITRDRIDVPTGWLVTDDLDSREESKVAVTDGGPNTSVPTEPGDSEILRAMRARFVADQVETEPENYHGVEDAGCSRRQFEYTVLG